MADETDRRIVALEQQVNALTRVVAYLTDALGWHLRDPNGGADEESHRKAREYVLERLNYLGGRHG